MKKTYEQPIVEIIVIEDKDVVTASISFTDEGDGVLTDYSNLFSK